MFVRAVAVTAALVGTACGSTPRGPLSQKAGDDRDEGAGDLAQASLRLQTPPPEERPTGFVEPRTNRAFDYFEGSFGGDSYGGATYGNAYGGVGYANWRMPQWSYNVPNRMPRYNVSIGLPGAIEGTVTWNGQMPPKSASACGPIDNPTLRVSRDKALRGVVVYIEKVSVGRGTPYYSRPTTVGGVLAKRGCALVPAVQIVAPLPGSVAIHGDTTRARIRVGTKTHDLQEGGLVQVEIKAGATKIDSDDGKLAPAWVLGLDTPYYAITDDTGRFRIDELAAGTHELTFWQPPVVTADAHGAWSYGAPIVVKRTVKVEAKTTHVTVPLPSR
jgi:hypothetical protein